MVMVMIPVSSACLPVPFRPRWFCNGSREKYNGSRGKHNEGMEGGSVMAVEKSITAVELSTVRDGGC